MELINSTPYQAQVFRTQLNDEHALAVLVVKATYFYDLEGVAELDRERPLPIYREYIVSDAGQLWPENFAMRTKADVFVLGRAMALGMRPTPQLAVRLWVGRRGVVARVLGRRTWRKRWFRGPQISEPEPFESIPLDWAHAFGGQANKDNPVGRGHVVDAAKVDGVELPNIEEPMQLIQRWSDRPRPLAFSPLPPRSALVSVSDIDELTRPAARSRSGTWSAGTATLNFAHPMLRLRELRERACVVMDGMNPRGRRGLVLEVPQVLAVTELGGRKARLFCKPDTLYLYPQQGRYAVTARRAFHLTMRDAEASVIRLGCAKWE